MTAPIRVLPRSLGVTVPLAALALAVAGCSTQQYPSDVPGTTPPVWTGSTSPGSHDESEISEGHDLESDEVGGQVGQVVELITAEGTAIGTVASVRRNDDLEVDVRVDAGSALAPGSYRVAFHTVAECEPLFETGNDAEFPFESSGDELTVDGAAVSVPSLQIADDGSGTLSFAADLPPQTGSLILTQSEAGEQERQACAVLF